MFFDTDLLQILPLAIFVHFWQPLMFQKKIGTRFNKVQFFSQPPSPPGQKRAKSSNLVIDSSDRDLTLNGPLFTDLTPK